MMLSHMGLGRGLRAACGEARPYSAPPLGTGHSSFFGLIIALDGATQGRTEKHYSNVGQAVAVSASAASVGQ
jgi:hypothetical protein